MFQYPGALRAFMPINLFNLQMKTCRCCDGGVRITLEFTCEWVLNKNLDGPTNLKILGVFLM